MRLPLVPLLWAGATALSSLSLKKDVDTQKNFARARQLGKASERNYLGKKDRLDKNRCRVNRDLEILGEIRVSIFTKEIEHLLKVVSRCRKAKSKMQGFNPELELKTEQVTAYRKQVSKAWEIQRSLVTGIGGGALTALGAYGAAGPLTTASTGTVIATLSGMAAKNATLVWLRGGTLSAGGFGMTGSMTLSGAVAGLVRAVARFMMASKAEQQLSKARKYQADIAVASKTIDAVHERLKELSMRVEALTEVTLKLRDAYNTNKVANPSPEQLETMIHIGTRLKAALELPVITDDGQAPKDFSTQCQGLLETDGVQT